ncbi:MAG: C1 family peptidase [Bacteroidota bacterium]
MNQNYSYGWRPDLPDFRDFMYAAPAPVLTNLPKHVDLRPSFPEVYDQGQLGSCTANAIAGAFQFELIRQNATVFMPSRLFIYYNERVIENTVNVDAGAYLRDGMKTLSNWGVCTESNWPYIVNEFTKKPYESCYQTALDHKATSYQRVIRQLEQMKACLADGYPFVFGFTVYNSFESREVTHTGVVNMPASNEYVVGGHAVLAVGYHEDSKRFIVRNSWGNTWGSSGYFTIPYEYLLNEKLSDDFWTIRMVSDIPDSAIQAVSL